MILSNVMLLFAVMLVCFFILQYKRFGRKACAIGGNEYTACPAWIRVELYEIIFYSIIYMAFIPILHLLFFRRE